MADALASGASELRLVKVQVLSPAPVKKEMATERWSFLFCWCGRTWAKPKKRKRWT